MQVIEFESIVQDQSIRLPDSCTLPGGQSVRVIVMYKQATRTETATTQNDAITRLLLQPLTIPGFTPLRRDEAHER